MLWWRAPERSPAIGLVVEAEVRRVLLHQAVALLPAAYRVSEEVKRKIGAAAHVRVAEAERAVDTSVAPDVPHEVLETPRQLGRELV